MENTNVSKQPRVASVQLVRVFLCTAACVLTAELIGSATLSFGGNLHVVLLPLVWALLIGAAWGIASPFLPGFAQVGAGLQATAATALQFALLIFIAKLGLLVGGALPKILTSGWGLVFQEFGHFFGTMIFGLPVALLLGIKREAIGATFSIGREPSLAIIGEKYGMASPEGHGVLAEYITGTVFGTIFIALFAGVIASLGLFNPLALAMGAGMGSGSLMAAASGTIAAQQTPEVAKEVAAFAAASNLITTTIGTYFTLFLSLPFTIWAYDRLEPILGRGPDRSTTSMSPAASADDTSAALSLPQILAVWVATGTIALIGNYLAFKTVPDLGAIAGLAIIIAPVAIGYLLYTLCRGLVPAVLWVSLIAMAMTYPGIPYAGDIAALTGKINFVALATPVISFAGLSIARDVPVFRRLGWRIVVVSLLANMGTFLGAALIAQFFLK